MSSRYDVIGPNTLEAIRRDSEIIRLKDRIEKLEAALQEFATCACISNCDEKNGRVCELWACRKALDAE